MDNLLENLDQLEDAFVFSTLADEEAIKIAQLLLKFYLEKNELSASHKEQLLFVLAEGSLHYNLASNLDLEALSSRTEQMEVGELVHALYIIGEARSEIYRGILESYLDNKHSDVSESAKNALVELNSRSRYQS